MWVGGCAFYCEYARTREKVIWAKTILVLIRKMPRRKGLGVGWKRRREDKMGHCRPRRRFVVVVG